MKPSTAGSMLGRRFLGWSLLMALAFGCSGRVPGARTVDAVSGARAGNPDGKTGMNINGMAVKSVKKGIGDTGFNQKAGALGATWIYNWQTEIQSGDVPEFIPMIWSGHFATSEIISSLKKSRAPALLGFNEPDLESQANMTVEEAIRLWPRLMETGLRLGSPSPAEGYCDGGCWLDRFMKEADKRGYRVDFIALHWYWDIRGKDAVPNLRKFLEGAYARFQKPVWLTEFGAMEQEGTPPLTEPEVAAFVREAIPMLESLPFLERYAWFATYTKKWKLYPASSLVDENGSLTVIGRAYAGE